MQPLIPLPNTDKTLPGPVQWIGGKGKLRKWVASYIPWSKVYCEPYGGAASVLCALEPRPVEVYNDLDGRLVNLFRVLQDPRKRRRLRSRLYYTPYSLDEFRLAMETLKDPQASDVDLAWAFFVAQNQGFGGKTGTEGNWGRGFVSNRGMAMTVSTWRHRVACLERWGRRFARLQIDSRDALEVIRYWDSPDTVFYCDPPYPLAARKDRRVYAHEASDQHLAELVKVLLEARGKVVLSCYDSPLWEPLREAGWRRLERRTACFAVGKLRGSKLTGLGNATKHAPRTEVLWLSSEPALTQERPQQEKTLAAERKENRRTAETQA